MELMSLFKDKTNVDRANWIFDPPAQTKCSADFDDSTLINEAEVHLCSGSHWLRFFHLFYPEASTFLDIGMNRGYWAADVFAIWRPSLGLNPRSLFMDGFSITQGGYCGWCGDCLSSESSYFHDTLPIPNFKVYGFEASRDLVRHWEINTKTAMSEDVRREWEVIHSAVSDLPGGTVMFPNGQDEAQSISREGADSLLPSSTRTAEMIKVDNTNVDEFVKVRSLDHIDFMKIDVNGHDLSVLRGSMGSIMANKIKGLIFEFTSPPLADWLTHKLSDAMGMLNEGGMTCYLMGDKKLVRLTGCFAEDHDTPFDVPTTFNAMCVSRRVERGAALIELLDVHTVNRMKNHL
ncbi:hypothetical protein TrVE_jg13073 [Triparma verrucosa]|uniref:Methyltransferase FkbM domain-containing protein n=1 Tax=Triparma verrucosa TaxID=1606542 RepID=A0A9W7C7A9_9STRA|nr:hypothetical protein TrVE_jg13073 [Triparma verrucosa]